MFTETRHLTRNRTWRPDSAITPREHSQTAPSAAAAAGRPATLSSRKTTHHVCSHTRTHLGEGERVHPNTRTAFCDAHFPQRRRELALEQVVPQRLIALFHCRFVYMNKRTRSSSSARSGIQLLTCATMATMASDAATYGRQRSGQRRTPPTTVAHVRLKWRWAPQNTLESSC